MKVAYLWQCVGLFFFVALTAAAQSFSREDRALLWLHNDVKLDGLAGAEFPGAVKLGRGYAFAIETKQYLLTVAGGEAIKIWLKPGEVRVITPARLKRPGDTGTTLEHRLIRKVVDQDYGMIGVWQYVCDGCGSVYRSARVGTCVVSFRGGDNVGWRMLYFYVKPGHYDVTVAPTKGSPITTAIDVPKGDARYLTYGSEGFAGIQYNPPNAFGTGLNWWDEEVQACIVE